MKVEFTGKNLTRFGGSGLIRRFLKRHKIKDLFDSKVSIEGRKARKYPTGTIFVGFLYGIFLGYSRPHHMNVLSADRVFQRLVGLAGFPVQSSISRFLSCMRVAVSRQIASLNFDFLMKFRRGFKEFEGITLDLDSHVMPVYGNQQRAGLGYNPKKRGRKSYHPLLCFVGETRDYIGGVLRSGKHHSSYNALEFLRGIRKKLPTHIKKIRFGQAVVFSAGR